MTRGDLTVITDPSHQVESPTGLIGSPDGDVWFTSIANGRVGRVRLPESRIETFADPAGQVALPANIFPGADGRMWFTCLGSNRLGAIDPASADPASTIRTYAHPAFDKPVALKSASGGRLWFSLRGADAIGTIDPLADDPEASVRIVTDPSITAPAALFIDAADRVWWVNGGNDTIGYVGAGPGAQVRAVRPPDRVGGLRGWSLDATGRLWLTTQRPAGLIRLDPEASDPGAGAAFVTDPTLQTPDGIWLSTNGALWFTDAGAHALVRFDPADGSFASFGGAPEVQGPFDIKPAGGPADDSLWFTDKDANTLGRIAT